MNDVAKLIMLCLLGACAVCTRCPSGAHNLLQLCPHLVGALPITSSCYIHAGSCYVTALLNAVLTLWSCCGHAVPMLCRAAKQTIKQKKDTHTRKHTRTHLWLISSTSGRGGGGGGTIRGPVQAG